MSSSFNREPQTPIYFSWWPCPFTFDHNNNNNKLLHTGIQVEACKWSAYNLLHSQEWVGQPNWKCKDPETGPDRERYLLLMLLLWAGVCGSKVMLIKVIKMQPFQLNVWHFKSNEKYSWSALHLASRKSLRFHTRNANYAEFDWQCLKQVN